jgi:hypothetical protein
LLAEERLGLLLNCDSGIVTEPERHLDQIYATILGASIPKHCSEHDQEVVYGHLTLILGSITVLFSTLSIKALGELLAVPTLRVSQTVAKLHSILDIPDDQAQPIRLHHDSFRNFLVDKKRCEDKRLLVTVRRAHARLATGCIKVMSSTLREDVCSQKAPGALLSDVGSDLVKDCLPEQTQYACLYWISHVVQSGQRLTDNDETHEFLRKHILHWIEAMSWMGKTPEAIEGMATLESMTKVIFSALAEPPGATISVLQSNMRLGRQVCESPCRCLRYEAVPDVREIWHREGTDADVCLGWAVYAHKECPASAIQDITR